MPSIRIHHQQNPLRADLLPPESLEGLVNELELLLEARDVRFFSARALVFRSAHRRCGIQSGCGGDALDLLGLHLLCLFL